MVVERLLKAGQIILVVVEFNIVLKLTQTVDIQSKAGLHLKDNPPKHFIKEVFTSSYLASSEP